MVWVFGAPPQNPNEIFLALCISNTTTLGIQTHGRWPIGYSGLGVWGAIQETEQFFWHYTVQTPPFPVSKSDGRTDGGLGRHPRTQTILLALYIPNTPISGVQKHLCWSMEYSGMGVWGTTPELRWFFFCIVQFKHHHTRYPKTLLLP